MKGMTYGFLAKPGFFRSPEGLAKTESLKDHNIEWVALIVNQFQETYASTRIFPDNARTVSDEELIWQIRKLHSMGIKVMLKPMVEPLDSVWRGQITCPKGIRIIQELNVDYSSMWFESYRNMISHYADIAEAENCELFCIGCELDGVEYRNDEWSGVIDSVRKSYSGSVTYNLTMNIHDLSDGRAWLKKLDLVGVSGYFKVGPADRSISLAEMIEGWKPWNEKLEKFSKWLGRPIFFAETGARPMRGAAGITGDFWVEGAVYSEQDQADYYISILENFKDKDYFYGVFYWKWDEQQERPQYYLKTGEYIGLEPQHRLAGEALKKWYASGAYPRKIISGEKN